MRTATILSAALAAASLALGAACSSGLPSEPSFVEKVERAADTDTSADRPQPEVTVPGPRFGPDTSPNRKQPFEMVEGPRLGVDTSPNRQQPGVMVPGARPGVDTSPNRQQP